MCSLTWENGAICLRRPLRSGAAQVPVDLDGRVQDGGPIAASGGRRREGRGGGGGRTRARRLRHPRRQVDERQGQGLGGEEARRQRHRPHRVRLV